MSAARRYARRLLDAAGHAQAALAGDADPPALAWRRAGLMEVTGAADGPGRVCPAALASAADGALLALRALVPDPEALPANGALLLGERARLLGLTRGGRTSPNGSCLLIAARDGDIALNLARSDDWELLAILVDSSAAVTDWNQLATLAGVQPAADLIARGIELGLPIARHGPTRTPDRPWDADLHSARPRKDRPLVVDLSALWAGPLAGSLLAMAGAEVIKVESLRRLDGAREGHAGFYDLLNAGKRSVTLDFSDPRDRAALGALIARADIVIEGSRPRALQALGIDRTAFVAKGAVWTSITAHPNPHRVGFGDDAAVAGGLSAVMEAAYGAPMFAGDAIADPLTGLHAALAAWSAWVSGHAGLLRHTLSTTVAFAATAGIAQGDLLCDWQAAADADTAPFYPLRHAGRAAAPGAHNRTVLGRC